MSKFTLCALAALLVGCTEVSADRMPYTVSVTALPERLDPWNTEVGGFHYLNSQLYYPLFEYQGFSQNLASAFLDMTRTAAIDSTLRQFRLCLRDGVLFSNGDQIRLGDLVDSLEHIHATHAALQTPDIALESGQCLRVTLRDSDSNYFDKLTTVTTYETLYRSRRGRRATRVPAGK